MSRGIFQYAQDIINDSSKSTGTTYSSNKIEDLLSNAQIAFYSTNNILTQKNIGMTQTVNSTNLSANISDIKVGQLVYDTNGVLGRITDINTALNTVIVETIHSNSSAGGCEVIIGCFATYPTTFNQGDMFFNTTDNLIYTATSNIGWDSGSTPTENILYINKDDKNIYSYIDNAFEAYGGSNVKISSKLDNAIEEITGSINSNENGLYVKDLSFELDKINIAQKTVNDVGEIQLLDMYENFEYTLPTTNGAAVDTIFNRAITLNDDITNYDYIDIYACLNSGRKYQPQVTRIKVDKIVYNNSNTLAEDGSRIGIYFNGMSSFSSAYGQFHISLKAWFKDSRTLFINDGYNSINDINCNVLTITDIMGKKEKSVTIDPVEYVNTEYGIEDSPVGHIINSIGSKDLEHYLKCDGSIYNITDYPHLAQHFKDSYGTSNVFGGDGTTTFAVPTYTKEPTKLIPTMTSNTVPAPIVISAKNVYSGYPAYYVADSNTANYWCSQTTGGTNWIQVDLGKRILATKVQLGIGESASSASYMATQVIVQGSNDNTTFDDIKTLAINTSNRNGTFDLGNTTPYRYYRLALSGCTNYYGVWRFQLLIDDIYYFVKYEPTYFMNIGDITYEYGCEKILGCFDLAPTTFSNGDKYFNTIDNLLYEVENSAWGVGQNPNPDVVYLNLDDNKIYNYNDGVFEAFGGGGTSSISRQPNNAIVSKSDGIYATDYANIISKLQNKKFSGLDKGYYFITGTINDLTKTWDAENSLILFIKNSLGEDNYIENSDLIVDANGYVLLNEGVWSLSAGTINESTNAVKYVWKDITGNILGNHGYIPAGDYGNTNIDANALVTVNSGEILKVAPVRLNNDGTVEQLYSFVLIQRVATADVDPVAYLSENGNLEEIPVGHITDFIGEDTPPHYLPCDGTVYNITDYPELALKIKNTYGKFEYFGGDGITTFAVPTYQEPNWYNIGMTVANSVSPTLAIKDNIIIQASSIYSEEYPVWKAFDNYVSTNDGDVFHTKLNDTNCELSIDFGVETMLEGFRIHTRYARIINSTTTQDYKYQIPSNFDLLGSNDGYTWTPIKSFNVPLPTTDGWIEYPFDTVANYKIYKLDNIKNAQGDSFISINEMEFKKINTSKYIKYESTHKAIFGDQTTYKVTVPYSVTTIPSDFSQVILDSANAEDDISLVDGNYLVAPMDGYYLISISSPVDSSNVSTSDITYFRLDWLVNGNIVSSYRNNSEADNRTTIGGNVLFRKLYKGDKVNCQVYQHGKAVTISGLTTMSLVNTLNENKVVEVMSKPNTWIVGQEYSFGDGIYGQRFTGSFTSANNSSNPNTTVTLMSPAPKMIVESGGTWFRSNNAGKWDYALGQTYLNGTTFDKLICSTFYINPSNDILGLAFHSNTANEPSTYDAWVKYTK